MSKPAKIYEEVSALSSRLTRGQFLTLVHLQHPDMHRVGERTRLDNRVLDLRVSCTPPALCAHILIVTGPHRAPRRNPSSRSTPASASSSGTTSTTRDSPRSSRPSSRRRRPSQAPRSSRWTTSGSLSSSRRARSSPSKCALPRIWSVCTRSDQVSGHVPRHRHALHRRG